MINEYPPISWRTISEKRIPLLVKKVKAVVLEKTEAQPSHNSKTSLRLCLTGTALSNKYRPSQLWTIKPWLKCAARTMRKWCLVLVNGTSWSSYTILWGNRPDRRREISYHQCGGSNCPELEYTLPEDGGDPNAMPAVSQSPAAVSAK